MQANKVAGVVMGGLMILAAPVMVLTLGLAVGWGIVLAAIGYMAMSDGLDNDGDDKQLRS